MKIGCLRSLVGKMNLDKHDTWKRIVNMFLKEWNENKNLLFKIIGITLLCSLLKHFQDNYEGNVSEMAFYVCYMLVIVLVVTSFTNIISVCTQAISKLKNFMNLIIPILITFLLTLGNIATASTIQPIILIMISFITTLISNLIIPVIIASTILNLVGSISKEVKVDNISKFFKKSMLYLIELIMLIFVRNTFSRRYIICRC